MMWLQKRHVLRTSIRRDILSTERKASLLLCQTLVGFCAKCWVEFPSLVLKKYDSEQRFYVCDVSERFYAGLAEDHLENLLLGINSKEE